ncbi:MAG TPA: O-antigen ligase family protein [Thermoanaerobaculia bacterium]|nr:O-antigen ligase family protein [Thermoanaerobaculia bacterium]
MPQASRTVRFAERGCLTILYAWLVWLPLPFGSIVERARLPLIATPLALCLFACLLRLYATRDRTSTALPTRASRIWAVGALGFLGVCALQLVPLAPGMLGVLSSESHAIWEAASRVASLAGAAPRAAWPLTVDPRASLVEWLRLAALFATFITSALMVRTQPRRRALAVCLALAAVFESLYGLREAALQRYEIWGWVNRLVFDRVTGTYVNPNHFAHYLAIVLPMMLFLFASLWRQTGRGEEKPARRVVMLLERHALAVGFTALAALTCLAGLLLSQSRGALATLGAAGLAVAAMLPGRRVLRIAAAASAGVVLIAALALFLGSERTITRFSPTDLGQQSVSRGQAAVTAVQIWKRFSLFGSGAGTFARVVSMDQNHDTDRIYHHAHNDYAELAATTGTLGFTVAMVTLVGGYILLVRQTFGEGAHELTFVRRAYQAAALLSLTMAMLHALFDFNFYIPANPATLAAIVGAAVASVDHDRRTRIGR